MEYHKNIEQNILLIKSFIGKHISFSGTLSLYHKYPTKIQKFYALINAIITKDFKQFYNISEKEFYSYFSKTENQIVVTPLQKVEFADGADKNMTMDFVTFHEAFHLIFDQNNLFNLNKKNSNTAQQFMEFLFNDYNQNIIDYISLSNKKELTKSEKLHFQKNCKEYKTNKNIINSKLLNSFFEESMADVFATFCIAKKYGIKKMQEFVMIASNGRFYDEHNRYLYNISLNKSDKIHTTHLAMETIANSIINEDLNLNCDFHTFLKFAFDASLKQFKESVSNHYILYSDMKEYINLKSIEFCEKNDLKLFEEPHLEYFDYIDLLNIDNNIIDKQNFYKLIFNTFNNDDFFKNPQNFLDNPIIKFYFDNDVKTINLESYKESFKQFYNLIIEDKQFNFNEKKEIFAKMLAFKIFNSNPTTLNLNQINEEEQFSFDFDNNNDLKDEDIKQTLFEFKYKQFKF